MLLEVQMSFSSSLRHLQRKGSTRLSLADVYFLYCIRSVFQIYSWHSIRIHSFSDGFQLFHPLFATCRAQQFAVMTLSAGVSWISRCPPCQWKPQFLHFSFAVLGFFMVGTSQSDYVIRLLMCALRVYLRMRPRWDPDFFDAFLKGFFPASDKKPWTKLDQGYAGPEMAVSRFVPRNQFFHVFPAFWKWEKMGLTSHWFLACSFVWSALHLQYGRSEVGDDMRGQLLEFGGSSLPTCSSRLTYHLFFSPFAQPTGWEVLCHHTFKNAGWSGLGSIALMPRSFVVMAEEEGFWP